MHGYQRKRRRPVAEINVVPYIDVMLVLLIIFMATAPVVSQGVKVDLPNAEAEPLAAESKPPIIAVIDAEGFYYLNAGDINKNTPMTMDELKEGVAAWLVVEPDRPVVVQADKNLPYEKVIEVMGALSKAGVPSVGLMTDSPQEK